MARWLYCASEKPCEFNRHGVCHCPAPCHWMASEKPARGRA